MRTRDIAIGFGAVITVFLVASSCAILADLNHTYEKDEGAGGGAQGSASSSGVGGGASGGGGGSAGGAGMGGAGMGGAGGAGGAVGYTWTAGDPTKGPGGMGGAGGGPSACAAYAYALPSWLKFESPTAGRSTQLSDDSLCVGFNSDEPRARNVFPKAMAKWGLSVESSRTNIVLQSDSWSITVNNFGWLSSQSDPPSDLKKSTNEPDPNVSGPDSATMFSSTTTPPLTGQHSRYFLADARVVSTWVRGEGLPKPGCNNPVSKSAELCYAHFRHYDAEGLYVNVKSDKWHRVSIGYDQPHSQALVLETRDVPSGAGVIQPPVSFVAYGAQAELTEAYPSSYIKTGDVPVTRAAEKLYSTDTNALLPGGFFKVTMKFAPNFAMDDTINEQSVSQYNLLFLGANYRLFLDKNERKLYLAIGNGEVSSEPLSFAREQELTITVENREGMPMTLTVAGANEGNGIFTGDIASKVDTSKTLYILGKDAGAEECSDLRFIQFE